uniref:ANK_REP_REGION domain-containing protein n=1 Tax=Macrostomum lignano TaxID=282301 RepID=A0A1I8FR46_9PLAT
PGNTLLEWLDYVVIVEVHKAPKSASLEADRLTADQDIIPTATRHLCSRTTCGPGPAPAPSLVDIYGGGCLVDCYENARSTPLSGRLSRRGVAPYLYKERAMVSRLAAPISSPQASHQSTRCPDEDPLKTQKRHGVHLGCAERGEASSNYFANSRAKIPNAKLLFASAAAVFDNNIKHTGLLGHHQAGYLRQLAIILVGMFPNLAKDFFIGWEYLRAGQSALHMAHAEQRLRDREDSSSRQVPIFIRRAAGDFFQPDDQRWIKKAKATNYQGHSTYYGEYPLSFACCIGSPEIYDYLIVSGADPSNRDQLGNNPTAVNHAGLNPISLAAKLGRRRVFNEIIGLSATEMWRYGDIACKLYPLTVWTPSAQWPHRLGLRFMHIINGQTSEHLDMLDEGVIRQLLYEKWNKYVRKRFLQRLALTIAYLSIMTLAVYLRPQENWNVSSNSTGIVRVSLQVNGQNVVRYICEIITVINSGLTIYFMINEIREQGFRAFTRSL